MSFPIKIQKVQVQQNDGTISNPIPLSPSVNIRQGEVETAVDIAHDESIGAHSEYSLTSGYQTKATAPNQTVVGQYNAENSDALFIVGDGTSESARSNAFEVLKNNNVKAQNLIVENNLTVRGTTTSIDSEVLTVADNMIVTNSLGEDIDSLSGLAIRKNQTDVYGIAYDSTDDTVKLGLGTIDADNNFAFNSGDGQAIATREGLENGDLVEWNAEKNTLVSTQERAKIGSAIVDNNVDYTKDVPKAAASYAKISKIGGMSRKCANLWTYGDVVSNNATYSIDNLSFPAGQYVFSCLVTSTDTDDTQSRVIFYDKNSKEYALYFERGSRNAATFTATAEIVSVVFYASVSSSTSAEDTFKFLEIMLNEGTTALPYEPYFEGLRSAKVTEVKSVGANLLNQAVSSGKGNCDIQFGASELLVTVVGYDPLWFYGDVIDYFNSLPKGQYYFYSEASGGAYVVLWGNQKPILNKKGYFDMPENLTMLHAELEGYVIGQTYTVKLAIYKVQKDEFKPYVEHTLPIPEAVRPANGINENVYDYIEWAEDVSVKKTVNCGVVDLGTLSWTKDADYGNYYFANISGKKQDVSNNLLCSIYEPTEDYGNNAADMTIRGSAGRELVFVRNNAYTDAATFKAAMSGVMLVYELAEPEVTDISDLITLDNLLPVEANGTVTMINEYAYDVPSEITFYEGQSGAVGADTFVGDLTGIASRSIADENGNNIAATYANKVVEEAQYDIAYDRNVPANLPTPWSKVTKIGGMSRKCKNLLLQTYSNGSSIGLVVNNDKTITINGTIGSYTAWHTLGAHTNLNGTLTLSGFPTGVSDSQSCLCVECDGTRVASDYGKGATFTATMGKSYIFYLRLSAGVTLSNVVVKPMLNEGSTALPYEPYYSELRDTKVTEVKSVGVNLLPLTYETSGTGSSGQKIIVNPDLSIEVSGKPTASSYNTLASLTLKAGTYSLRDYGTSSQDVRLYVTYGESTTLFAPTTFTLNEETSIRIRLAVYDTFNGNTVTIKPVFVRGSVVPQSYTQAVRHTLPIPEAVQALDGYGLGINENLYNYLEWKPEDNIKTWHKNVHKIVFDGVTTGRKMDVTDPQSDKETYYAYAYQASIPVAHQTSTVINDDTIICGTTKVLSLALSATILGLGATPTKDEITTAINKYLNDKYNEGNPVEVVCQLPTPEVTDISELLSDDNFIRVEEGGTVYAENSYHYEAPLEIIYHKDINEARSKGLTIDNMKQSVTRAVYAETAMSFSGNSLTIGNTTLTETQLQKLLALLNEIEFA